MALATGIRVALLPGMTGSAIMEYSDWYYAACTYHSQQYQTPHKALQDVVNHEAERGNTVNVENEARIFCVKDGSGNVLYYEAGFED